MTIQNQQVNNENENSNHAITHIKEELASRFKTIYHVSPKNFVTHHHMDATEITKVIIVDKIQTRIHIFMHGRT